VFEIGKMADKPHAGGRDAIVCSLSLRYNDLQDLSSTLYILPEAVAPGGRAKKTTATGVLGASEPLCIAQGAVANVPKFPRRHRSNPIDSPRLLSPLSQSCLYARLSQLTCPPPSPPKHITFNPPTPSCCLRYASPRYHVSLMHPAQPPTHDGHPIH